VLVIVAVLAGCAQTTVQPLQQTSIERLPRPSIVLVHKFSVSGAEVTAAQGLYGDAVQAAEHESVGQEEAALGQEVSNAVTDELVKRISGMGLEAQRASLDTDVAENALIITGYFVDIDEGNRMQQLVIGLGLGQSKMDTKVQVRSARGGRYHALLEFETHADSGAMPGAAVTMGAGAAAQGGLSAGMAAANVAAAGVKAYRTAMGPMADRTADKAAAYLGKFFAGQGWISPDQVPQSVF
jgi:hypothetical protein